MKIARKIIAVILLFCALLLMSGMAAEPESSEAPISKETAETTVMPEPEPTNEPITILEPTQETLETPEPTETPESTQIQMPEPKDEAESPEILEIGIMPLSASVNGLHYYPHNNHTISETGGVQRGATLWTAVSDGATVQWAVWPAGGSPNWVEANYEGYNEYGHIYSYNLYAFNYGNVYGDWYADCYVDGSFVGGFKIYIAYGPYLGNEKLTPTAKAGTIGQALTLEWQGRTASIVDCDPTSTSVRWQKNINGTWIDRAWGGLPWNPTATFTPDASDLGIYQWRCIVSNNNGYNVSNPTTVTVRAIPPTITKNPQNMNTISGNAVTLSATASSNPACTYQWQRFNGSTWVNIAGATAATYRITAGKADHQARFRLVASNASYYGGASVTSQEATLSVSGIGTQPQNQTADYGENAVFSVSAYGSISAYQWQKSKNGTTWENISGATGNTYTAMAVKDADSGTRYRCVVSTAAGQVTSAAATLTVNPRIISALVPAQVSFTLNPNQPVNFTSDTSGNKAFSAAPIVFRNTGKYPLLFSVDSIAEKGNVPKVVDEREFTDDEWRNMNWLETKKYIAFGFETPDTSAWNSLANSSGWYCPSQPYIIGSLDAGKEASQLLKAKYGTAWGIEEEKEIEYGIVYGVSLVD